MFKWFNKTRNKDSIPQHSSNVGMLLMLQMEKYIQENKELSETCTEDPEQLKIAYCDLLSVGLESSKNAKLIKQRLDNISVINENIERASKLLQFVRELRAHFGKSTLLIGTEQFEKICKKYKLVTGSIKHYTGVIPDKNINELKLASKKCSSFKCGINTSNGKYHLWHIHEVVPAHSIVDNKEVESLAQWIRSKHGVVLADTSNTRYDGLLNLDTIKYCNPDIPKEIIDYKWNNLLCLSGNIMDNTSMFIACPSNQLKEQPIEITVNTIDPIVFQYSEYGIIIHTMWGEESEDVMFEEYKKLNNLMTL